MDLINSIDQLGNSVEINFPPGRIVSLVPSQTEFLFDLGLNEEIVGVTRFCVHPKNQVNQKEKIGGTKQFNIEKIKSLSPDLIIGNKEENYREGIEELQKHYPVWMSDIFNLEDAYSMMTEVSRVANRQAEGNRIVKEIKQGFENLPKADKPATAAYFIWRKPYMVAAGNTFINHMLNLLGYTNVFEHSERYPIIDPVLIAQLKPDYIFLSSEPYSFSEKHLDEFRDFCAGSKAVLVDGEMFIWYGSRLRLAAQYFSNLKKSLPQL